MTVLFSFRFKGNVPNSTLLSSKLCLCSSVADINNLKHSWQAKFWHWLLVHPTIQRFTKDASSFKRELASQNVGRTANNLPQREKGPTLSQELTSWRCNPGKRERIYCKADIPFQPLRIEKFRAWRFVCILKCPLRM